MLKKNSKKNFKVVTDIKFNRFQWKSINTVDGLDGSKKRCLSCIRSQQDITITLMTMKTTINTGKNQ